MNCPYCGEQMAGGDVVTIGRGLRPTWVPRFGEPTPGTRIDSITLGNFKLLRTNRFEAFVCPGCKKLIVDL